jgi:Protein of unknown function (DUF3617)
MVAYRACARKFGKTTPPSAAVARQFTSWAACATMASHLPQGVAMSLIRPVSASIVLACLYGLCVGASAQSLKPGLWEITQQIKMGSGGMNDKMAAMQQQMAQMPPEQRKMMEDMMARQGVKMGAAGPGSMGIKTCMTQEMVERNQVPTQQGDCTSTSSPRVGNTMKIAFTCTQPPSSGEGEVTFIGSDAYSLKIKVNTQVGGKPEAMDMEGGGKWLGANCGDIKPAALSKK